MGTGNVGSTHHTPGREFAILGFLIIFSVSVLIGIQMTVPARKKAVKRECAENLRQLGQFLWLYVSRYGEECYLPPMRKTPNFLNYLRVIPNTTLAVAAGRHGLFVCPVLGTLPGPGVLDYKYAAWTFYGDTLPPDYPCACDRASNHNPHMEDDINVLLFNGSVKAAVPGDFLWSSCVGPMSGIWMEGP